MYYINFNLATFIVLASVLIYIYIRYVQTFWRRQQMPYLEPTFFFGNIKPVIFRKFCFAETAAALHSQLKQNGEKFGGIYTLTIPNLLIVDPELIKDMFVKNFSSFCDRGLYYDEDVDPLSAHLGAINNPKWKFLRYKFSPIFTPAKMKMVFPILQCCANDMISEIEKITENNSPLDTRDIMGRYTTDIIVRVAMGIEANAIKNPKNQFVQIGKDFLGPSLRNSLILTFTFIAPEILRVFKIPIAPKRVIKFFMNVISQTVNYRESNNIEKKDLMDVLIKIKNNKSVEDIEKEDDSMNISFNELAAQAFLFFLGGYDTSSATLTFFFFEMAKNKDIQRKLRKEINKAIDKNNGCIDYDVLMDLPYLNCCVNECFRKYPVVSTVNRVCVKDYLIPESDKIIYKGTKVMTSILGLHHDPEYFPYPNTYNPDRFSDENKSKIIPNTYLPFGIGPRNCIGYRFGLMTVKMCLVTFLKDFEVSFYPGIEIPKRYSPVNFLLDFDKTLWLKVEKI